LKNSFQTRRASKINAYANMHDGHWTTTPNKVTSESDRVIPPNPLPSDVAITLALAITVAWQSGATLNTPPTIKSLIYDYY